MTGRLLVTTEMSQAFVIGVIPSRTSPNYDERRTPTDTSNAESDIPTPGRQFQFVAAAVMLSLLGVGFVASAVGKSGWSRAVDLEQLKAQVVATIALLVLLACWIGFTV